jgi:hypothetical protein
MKTYNFTVGGQTYTVEATDFTEARAKLRALIAAL